MKTSRTSLVVLGAMVVAITLASTWRAGRQDAQVGEQVAALAKPGDIRMLSSQTCAICKVARAWFTEHQVAHAECVIERDAACKLEFKALQSPGTPVMLVRGKAQLGFNPVRLLATLQGSG